MLSCLPESCWSACLTLVVSGSLCAELITGYEEPTGNQIGLLEGFRFWGGVGNLIDYFAAIMLHCLSCASYGKELVRKLRITYILTV